MPQGDTAQFVGQVASHALAFGAGILIALLGVWYRNRVEKRRAREESVRGLVTAATPVRDNLARALSHYQQVVRHDPQQVPELFKTGDLLSTESLQALTLAIERANALPQICLRSWRQALDACRLAEQQHAGLRNLIGRPGHRSKLVDRRHEYAEELRVAIDGVRVAAASTEPWAPLDSRSSITDLSRKG